MRVESKGMEAFNDMGAFSGFLYTENVLVAVVRIRPSLWAKATFKRILEGIIVILTTLFYACQINLPYSQNSP
jgi:hypothetical protein